MSNLNKFLEKILIKDSILEKLNDDKITEDEIKGLADRYLKSRNEHYEAKVLPSKLKEREDQTIEKYNIKIRKNLREFAGLTGDLTNAKMDEYKGKSIDLFFDDVKEIFDKTIKEKTGGVKNELSTEVEKWKDLATQRQKKVEEYESKIENIKETTKKEYESKYTKERAKIAYRKWLSDMQREGKIAAGNEYAYENIESKIFSDKYKVDEDLNLFNSDDSKAIHPEKEVVLDNVKDLAMYHIEKARLNKENKARELPKSFEKMVSTKSVSGDGDVAKLKKRKIEEYAAQLNKAGNSLKV